MDLPKAIDLKGKALNAITVLSEFHNLLKIKIDDIQKIESLSGDISVNIQKLNVELDSLKAQVASAKAEKSSIERDVLAWKEKEIAEINALKKKTVADNDEASMALLSLKAKEVELAEKIVEFEDRKRNLKRDLEEKLNKMAALVESK